LVRAHAAVVHFAAEICVGESVFRPASYFGTNVVDTLPLLSVASEHGTPFVFSSSAAVYGVPAWVPVYEDNTRLPINPYGATKLAVEHALEAYGKAYGLPWAALRYFNAAGAHHDGTMHEDHDPETHLIPLAIDAALGKRDKLALFGNDYSTPDGTCIRDYVHVEDLARAHLLALDKLLDGKPVGAVNLGSGQGYSVGEVIRLVGEQLGKRVPFSVQPRRPGDPRALVASIGLAKTTLGWKPERSDLATIIEDTIRSRRA
jgi:UDP-glucose-4-epimerase GalE